MSSFGRSMLEKYGWKEGKGLGKEESGISKPIKVAGNFNSYGLGHDVGQEFTNQWWDHLYNKTASSVTVGSYEDGSVKFTRSGDLQVTQKVIPYVNAESSQYSRFVKAGQVTDTHGDEVQEGEAVSYTEVFKISGGSTAHKGARHGLTMAAKLFRIEKQERELLDKWKNSKSRQIKDHVPNVSANVDNKNKSIKKKRKHSADFKDNECSTSVNCDFQSEHLSKKHKKKKKAKLCAEEAVNEDFLHRQRMCNEKLADEEENNNSNEKHSREMDSTDVSVKKRLKKKHRKPDLYEKENAETEINPFEIVIVKEKKKKKSKRKSPDTVNKNISQDTLRQEQGKESPYLIPEVQIDLVNIKKKKKKIMVDN